MSGGGGRGGRADSTFLGYAIVLGVIALVVLGLALVVNSRQEEYIPSVDYAADATYLSQIAPYRSYAPEGLPEGWTPTSSRLETGTEAGAETAAASPGGEPTGPVRWTLGFATPTDRYAAFSISDGDPDGFVAELTMNGDPDGESVVDGETWQRYYNATESERSLVRREEDATLIVAGSSQYDELEVLAAALRLQENPG